jgi:hypothetical protein
MPTIRVDSEVFAELQGEAVPFKDTPNSVLRRLLRLDPQASSGSYGELSLLIAVGKLRIGEKLVWPRPRRGKTHHATVLRDGSLELEDGRVFRSPSGAAKALADHEINGWRQWRRASDGTRLDQLR